MFRERRILATTRAFRNTALAVLAFCCAAKPLHAQTAVRAGDSLSIDAVVFDVLRHNDRIAAMSFMEKAAETKVGSAGAWDDPMLMLGVNNLPTSFDFKMDPMTMQMIGLSWNIPYAGQKGLQKKAAAAEAAVARLDRLDAELELATAGKLAFYELYYNTRTVELLSKQLEVMRDVVASIKSGVATSQTNPEDAVAAQADLWRLQTQLMPAVHSAESARYELNTLRGMPADQSTTALKTPQLSRLPDSAEVVVAEARANYPLLKKLRQQSLAYTFSSAAEGRMRLPMLELSGTYNYRADTEMEKRDDMIGVQANISLPLFSSRKQSAMSRSMDLMRRSVDLETAQLEREIVARVKKLYLDALHLRENLGIYSERIIPADEDAYRLAFSGYTNNRTSLATLLNYARTMYRDRMVANELKLELATTMAELERYTTDPATLPDVEIEDNHTEKDR